MIFFTSAGGQRELNAFEMMTWEFQLELVLEVASQESRITWNKVSLLPKSNILLSRIVPSLMSYHIVPCHFRALLSFDVSYPALNCLP